MGTIEELFVKFETKMDRILLLQGTLIERLQNTEDKVSALNEDSKGISPTFHL